MKIRIVIIFKYIEVHKKVMKILYATLRPPYSTYKGDQLIAYNQIKNLGGKYDLDLLTFINDQKEKKELIRELKDHCNNIFFIELKNNKLLNLLKTFINKKPFQVNMFFEEKIQKQIDSIINKEKPDLIHVQTIRMADYFTNYSIPKTIDMIDALSLNMKRRANNENLLKKPIFEIESRLCRNYERDIYKKFDKLFLVSQKDKDYYENNNKIIVNPNGTFITRTKLKNYSFDKEKYSLVFHGNMQYYPNIESVIYFVNEIFPILKEKYPEINFYIVGKDPVEKVKKLNEVPGVIVTGFVDDIIDVLTTKIIGVYFMKSGTGMQNKILEALACKLPSVATSLALQGIKGINKNHIKIANKKEQFIDKIINLIEDEKYRNIIAENGHEFIMENYSWESNTQKLVQVWEDVLDTY